MADVEENWQTKITTVRERTTFVFNNELLSDVKFVVAASSESGSKKAKMVIPAHKFVLAISSPVFYSMFYGQLAETSDSIELPDCEYESLLELFRYLYSDKVNLNESNVMQVFYLAKKYMVPSLADKCSKYLRDNLEGSNVFSILLHAQRFEDQSLEERCWTVIKTQARRALLSDEFVTLERSMVETVVKKDRLFVKEVELFKAIDCWATKETERQGLSPDGNIKRQILGEEIVKAIRFPLMSQKEFASVVPDCNILTMKEVGDMMKHYSDVLTTPLPFIQTPRSGPILRCFRFREVESPLRVVQVEPPFSLFGLVKKFSVCVSTSRMIFLHGVQLFGCENGEYTGDIQVVENTVSGSSLMKHSGKYVSKRDVASTFNGSTMLERSARGKKKESGNNVCYGYDVMFDHPICLTTGKAYKIVCQIEGPPSWRGTDDVASVHSHGVTFTFRRDERDLFSSCSWQFPALIFSL